MSAPENLFTHLHERLQAYGRLTFAQWMAEALYHPQWGYYGAGRATIGRRGDFITSVSVGALFGRLLARQWVEMWERLGQPAEATLVEAGAHDGSLAADLLQGLQDFAPACHAATRYLIVEPGAAWQTRQQAKLSQHPQVAWATTWDEIPPFIGAHLSNELLDAFPVHAVEWRSGQWQERYVVADGDSFAWELGPLYSETLAAHLRTIPGPLPDGFRTEVNLQLEPWLRAVTSRLTRGWILALDYGYERVEYYRPERSHGTLSAYRAQKRVEDPLSHPGEVDLTAHVDWTTLEELAPRLGLLPAGFTDQQRFLIRLAASYFQDTAEVTPALAQEHRQFRTLTHPEILGAAFTAICFAKNVPVEPALTGFRALL